MLYTIICETCGDQTTIWRYQDFLVIATDHCDASVIPHHRMLRRMQRGNILIR